MKVSVQLRKFAKTNSKSKVYFRVRDGRKDIKAVSTMTIEEEYWDSATSGYKRTTPTKIVPRNVQQVFNNKVKSIIIKIYESYNQDSDVIWLSSVIDDVESQFETTETEKQESHEERIATTEQKNAEAKKLGDKTLLEFFQIYLDTSHFNDWHLQAQTSVMHKVKRFEGWLGYLAGNRHFKLYLPYFDKAGTEEYLKYIEHEDEYREQYPEYFNTVKLRKPNDIAPLSQNTLSVSMKRLFMFLNWAYKNGYMKHQDYNNVTLCQQVYTDPYYLTLEERDKIFYHHFNDPRLELHRDKFMFQCLIGCRSNDLEMFTWNHIIGDFIEYIPHKNLLLGKSDVVRCPLCDKAKAILERIDPEAPYLFLNYCPEVYRKDIKRILEEVGINRLVTVIEPKTRKAVQKPIYEVAASHLARRTFIGNLYKQVKDPALISSLTGHSEHSTSFSRYRAIDDDIKRDVLKLIQ